MTRLETPPERCNTWFHNAARACQEALVGDKGVIRHKPNRHDEVVGAVLEIPHRTSGHDVHFWEDASGTRWIGYAPRNGDVQYRMDVRKRLIRRESIPSEPAKDIPPDIEWRLQAAHIGYRNRKDLETGLLVEESSDALRKNL